MAFTLPSGSTLRKTVLSVLSNGGGAYLALFVLLLICSLTNPQFGTSRNLLNVLRQSSYTGLIALGMTFVIVAGGIDLSVGSMFALCGVLSVTLFNLLPADSLAATPGLFAAGLALTAIACGAVAGALNGTLVTIGKLPPFIATLGTYSVFRSLALYVADSGNASLAVPALKNSIQAFGGAALLKLPVPVWFLLGLALVLGVVLARTRAGRHTLATGASERVASFAGISVGFVRFRTYLLIGALAGLSAFLMLGRLGTISSSNAGMLYELDAIAAVIIGGASMNGGRGTIAGTLAGVLVLGIVTNILDLWGINPALQGTVKGLVIILSVLIQRKRA